MGILEKRRSVRAMARRWQTDLRRLEQLFGGYDGDDLTDGAEMQRNLGTALEHARGFLTAHSSHVRGEK